MNESFDKEIREVFLDEIIPNRFQPRLNFDQKALLELAESIKQHGIIQPLVLRKLGEKYEIIAGERRYKASQIAGLSKVPAIIMDLDDNKSAEVAIVENLHRKDMSALEEAKSFKKLLQRGITQEQLGISLGKSQSYIANKLRLLSLEEKIQESLLREEISERHARSLLTINDSNDRQNMLEEIIKRRLTVKETDDLIKERYGAEEPVEESLQAKKIENITEVEPTTIEDKPNIMNFNLENIEENLFEPKVNVPKPFVLFDESEETSNQGTNKVPEPHNNYETNPQMNLINRLSNIENGSESISFKETNIVKPSPYVIPKKDIEDSYLTPKSNYNLNEIKPTNQDKPQDVPGSFDIDHLLYSEKKNEETQQIEQATQNRFIVGNDEVKDSEMGDIVNSKNMIKKIIETIKNSGVKIDYEEFDFERLYQIIIKIDK